MSTRLANSPWLRAAALLSVLSTASFSVGLAAQDPDLAALRRDVLARFEAVPLREGVALAGRARDGHVEIVDGLVLSGGTPLAGGELRDRLGTDADLVLKLSYLTNEQLRAMFTAPAPAATPSTPATPNSAPIPPPPSPPTAVEPPPPAAPAAEAPADSAAVAASASRAYRRTGARLAFGKSITVEEDEHVTEGVVSLLGNVIVAGRVSDDVVAIGGNVSLSPTAEVRGDITVVGGAVTIAPGAQHSGAVHQAVFQGWSWPVFGWARVDVDRATKWLTLAGTATRVLLLVLAVGVIVAMARTRVGRVGAAVAATPLRAAAVGLGAQVLFVPALVVVTIAMAVTIVGLPFLVIVIPLALAIMLAAMLLGIASLSQTLGAWTATQLGWRVDTPLLAAAIGLGLIVLPTILARLVGVGPSATNAVAFGLLMVGTAVEYLAWTVGLGAAIVTGLGRWSTAPPELPVPDAPTSL